MTCRISRFQDGGSLNNYITIFLAEGIWKVHIFCHLFVCFQTSVYTLGEFHKNRNNSTVFESVLIDPLRVANKTAFATIKSTIYTSNSSNTVLLFLNSNMTSFFRFVDKRAIYRWYNFIRMAMVNVTDFSIGSIICVRHFPQA